MLRRFCEITSYSILAEPGRLGSGRRCDHMGLRRCQLHDEPLTEHEGWRVCCASCTTPTQIVETARLP